MGIFEFAEEETVPNTESQEWKGGFPEFDDDLMFGYFFKDIIVLLLDKCGYEVYPYGYESFFPNLKRKLYNTENPKAADRIRSTPDLLVRNPNDQQVEIVEVKARSATGAYGLKIDGIERYLKFWLESVMILVIPSGNYFYAQRISELKSQTSYSPQDFRPLEEIFPLVKGLPEDFRKKLVRKVRTLCLNRDYANF